MERQKFQSLWEKFTTTLRGKLMRSAQKQALTLPLARLLLAEEALAWGSEYDAAGRWLTQYTAQNPDKGALIRQILLTDMQFTTACDVTPLPSWTAPVAAAVGGVAGLAVSRLAFHASLWVQAAATLVPAALAGIGVQMASSARTAEASRKAITAYMAQLEKFRVSVESVLAN